MLWVFVSLEKNNSIVMFLPFHRRNTFQLFRKAEWRNGGRFELCIGEKPKM